MIEEAGRYAPCDASLYPLRSVAALPSVGQASKSSCPLMQPGLPACAPGMATTLPTPVSHNR